MFNLHLESATQFFAYPNLICPLQATRFQDEKSHISTTLRRNSAFFLFPFHCHAFGYLCPIALSPILPALYQVIHIRQHTNQLYTISVLRSTAKEHNLPLAHFNNLLVCSNIQLTIITCTSHTPLPQASNHSLLMTMFHYTSCCVIKTFQHFIYMNTTRINAYVFLNKY